MHEKAHKYSHVTALYTQIDSAIVGKLFLNNKYWRNINETIRCHLKQNRKTR